VRALTAAREARALPGLTILLLGCALFVSSCASDSGDDTEKPHHHRHGNGHGRDREQSETSDSSNIPSPTPALGW